MSRSLTTNPELDVRIGDQKNCDLASEDSLVRVCQDVDCIIHLAALNEIQCAENPEQAFMINGLGTYKLLKAAIQAKVKRFIYFSTIHVYGSPLAGDITEETIPRPVHPYSISKKIGEDFVLSAHDQGKIEGVVLRLSNALGSPVVKNIDRWKLVCNDLCRQAVLNKEIVLESDGLQWRDFITIHDVERVVEFFISLGKDNLGNGLFNLGGEMPLRIHDLAQSVSRMCHEVMGFAPNIIRGGNKNRKEDQSLDYKIEKLKKIGFHLTGNRDDEIRSTLGYCQKELRNS